MSVRMLSIDPGTHCGYSWLDVVCPAPTGLRPVPSYAGVWDLSVKRHEGGGMRFLRLKKHLMELEPKFVLYEEVRGHKGTSAAHIYGGIVAMIQTYCEEYDVNYIAVPVGTIKKRASGKGNCGKDVMIETANAEFVSPPSEVITDDNIADAMWLLQIGLEEYAHVLTDGAK